MRCLCIARPGKYTNNNRNLQFVLKSISCRRNDSFFLYWPVMKLYYVFFFLFCGILSNYLDKQINVRHLIKIECITIQIKNEWMVKSFEREFLLFEVDGHSSAISQTIFLKLMIT